MKLRNITLSIILIFTLTFNLNGQESFKIDLIDSSNLKKNELYSATKQFIAQTWKSANNVIQNDDRDGGNVVVKGVSEMKVPGMFGYTYIYAYTFTFRVKDEKFRITLDNIYCENAKVKSNNSCDLKLIQPFDGDNCPSTSSIFCIGPSKSKAIEMMNSLRKEMNYIAYLYSIAMKNHKKVSDDW